MSQKTISERGRFIPHPLSLEPGGETVYILYKNGKTEPHPRVKRPAAYSKTVVAKHLSPDSIAQIYTIPQNAVKLVYYECSTIGKK